MSLVPVLDVEAPPPAPPAPPAPRGRLRSLFLVLCAVLMSASMGLVIAAPPAAALVQFAVPIAATAMRIAPSAVKLITGKAAMTPMTGLLGGGLALGAAGFAGDALGGSWDDDAIWKKFGIKMPWDAKADAVIPDVSNGNKNVKAYNTLTVTRIEWTSVAGPNITGPTLRIEGTCAGTSVCGAPGDAYNYSVVRVHAKCFDPVAKTWSEPTYSLTMNGRVRDLNGNPPCMRTNPTRLDQLASLEVRNTDSTDWVSYKIANPEKYINPDFDPDQIQGVTITGTAQCKHPTTGELRTVTNISQDPGTLPAVQCPAGWTPQSMGWTSTLPDGTTKDLGGVGYDFSEFPLCADMSCVLRVTMDGVPCRVGIDDCYDWMRVEPKSRVACEYGPYALGLAQCRDLEHIYKTTPGVTPNPGPPGQPQPRPAPDGTPQEVPTRLVPSGPDGQPIPDMIPGTPIRPDPYPPTVPTTNPTTAPTAPSTNPTTNPTTAPSNPPFPTSGVNPPIAPPGVPPPKNPDAPNENCIAQGWSWNPVDWVYIPVKCALTWAFIPKDGPGLIARAGDTFNGTGMGDWLGIVPAWIDALPEGGVACMGPPLTVPATMGGATYYPLNACSDPMAKYAQMSRAVMTVVVSFAGVISIVNSVTLAFTGYRAFEREGLAIQAAASKEAERTRSK